MTQTIPTTDPRLSWPGAVSLQHGDGWTLPWRIDHADQGLFAAPLAERAAMPAGVRILFSSDTTHLSGRIDSLPALEPGEARLVDLCCDGEVVGSQDLGAAGTFQFEDLPPGRKRLELWLPQFGLCRVHGLTVSDGATVEPAADARPRWITYGSSITQCRTAASPTQTWPAIAARTHGLNLTCLGFGGQCHLDPMMARTIRDLPADYVSMCVGININGGATLNARTFGPGIIGFVQIVREKHPNTPLVILSPICSPPRERVPNLVGLSLAHMRVEVAVAVAALRDHGDEHVHYVDGLSILGPEEAHLLPDEVHPNAEGYRLMGERFADQVVARYFVK